ncbi:DUF2946 family protein [Pseudaminobacter soli (ex Li et al. 2025)]|uniref:DUF2946 domain-containing protein n=1 Tax=Pseudaminobacter soli (ex Li et al. 2025) TaxID=1295366 RepID=A0A2P7SEC9_9HYPH|nr:DUF2946 family protein [Mesorhizobium soli]PSJ60838.1 hypothetical protein C7I85_12430 [Mesorhizobium soli]
MCNFRHKGWNILVALVAAYLLVLQSAVGALALGASSNSLQLDAFGNPICSSGMDSKGESPAGKDHKNMPDCCTVACSMFAPVAAIDRTAAFVAKPARSVSVSLPAHFEGSPASRLDHDPGRPRAPPLMA